MIKVHQHRTREAVFQRIEVVVRNAPFDFAVLDGRLNRGDRVSPRAHVLHEQDGTRVAVLSLILQRGPFLRLEGVELGIYHAIPCTLPPFLGVVETLVVLIAADIPNGQGVGFRYPSVPAADNLVTPTSVQEGIKPEGLHHLARGIPVDSPGGQHIIPGHKLRRTLHDGLQGRDIEVQVPQIVRVLVQFSPIHPVAVLALHRGHDVLLQVRVNRREGQPLNFRIAHILSFSQIPSCPGCNLP